MAKFMKSQIAMLSLLILLIFITPLISSSLRPKYLYFVINLLIVALGAEAGLLSFMSKPPTPQISITTPNAQTCSSGEKYGHVKAIGKSKSERIEMEKNKEVKKCPSMPSLFFIGGGEGSDVDEDVSEEDNEELFTKAEPFISNFYNQLKMQREES